MVDIKMMSSVISERSNNYNAKALFIQFTGKIPSSKLINGIKKENIIKWIKVNYDMNVRSILHLEEAFINCDLTKRDQVYIMMNQEVMIAMVNESVEILFVQEYEKEAGFLFDMCRTFLKRERRRSEISLVTSGLHGMDTIEIRITKPKMTLEEHYNDDLSEIHPVILSNLRKVKKSGLLLFYGIPGTGKTTYIRHLIHLVNKKVVFMPPKIAGELDSPEFTSFLIENQNTIFIIEDAEELLVSRSFGNNSAISMLLNLTDGLLGECLGIQFIVTFNTPVYNLDKALLRKGRLIAMYEFKALCKKKANSLLKSMNNIDFTVTDDTTLADIYNIQNRDYKLVNNENKIGFKCK